MFGGKRQVSLQNASSMLSRPSGFSFGPSEIGFVGTWKWLTWDEVEALPEIRFSSLSIEQFQHLSAALDSSDPNPLQGINLVFPLPASIMQLLTLRQMTSPPGPIGIDKGQCTDCFSPSLASIKMGASVEQRFEAWSNIERNHNVQLKMSPSRVFATYTFLFSSRNWSRV